MAVRGADVAAKVAARCGDLAAQLASVPLGDLAVRSDVRDAIRKRTGEAVRVVFATVRRPLRDVLDAATTAGGDNLAADGGLGCPHHSPPASKPESCAARHVNLVSMGTGPLQ